MANIIQNKAKRDMVVKIVADQNSTKSKASVNIFLPPYSNEREDDKEFRNRKIRKKTLQAHYESIVNKEIKKFKIITEDYKFEGFMKGKYKDTDIRARAAKEKLRSIVLKTELETNVKILHPDL